MAALQRTLHYKMLPSGSWYMVGVAFGLHQAGDLKLLCKVLDKYACNMLKYSIVGVLKKLLGKILPKGYIVCSSWC